MIQFVHAKFEIVIIFIIFITNKYFDKLRTLFIIYIQIQFVEGNNSNAVYAEMYNCIPTPVELIKLQQINHSKVLLDPNARPKQVSPYHLQIPT